MPENTARPSGVRAVWYVRAVMAARVALAGLFWYGWRRGNQGVALASVVLAVLSDLLDGHLARIWSVSERGGYLDATADLIYVTAAMVLYVERGLYPWWVLALIIVMFAQFVATSGLAAPVYDPVGKYYGIGLYVAVGATLLWPNPVVRALIMTGLVLLSAASLVSRARHLNRDRAAKHS